MQKHFCDGAGREIEDDTTDGGVLAGAAQPGTTQPSTTAAWTAASTITSDIVLEQTLTTYDAAGNVIETLQRQRFDNDTSFTGPLYGPSDFYASRDYYTVNWYDAANRLTDSANFGTNGGTMYAPYNSAPPSLPPAEHVLNGKATATSSSQLIDDTRSEPSNYFDGYKISIISGTGVRASHCGQCTAYDRTSGTTFTYSPAFATDTSSVYSLTPEPIATSATGGSTQYLFSNLTQPTDMFIGWTIQFTSGANTGRSAVIGSWSGGTLDFFPSMPNSVASGDQFTLTPPVEMTHTDYNAAGEVQDTIDPRGIASGMIYDMLGRQN